MTTYQIEPERASLHGSFSRSFPSILTIETGDSVQVRTLDAGWHLGPTSEEPPQRFEPRDKERDAGHALCGPIAIRGAQPGMTLAIHIQEIRPGTWGWTGAGGKERAINRRLGLLEKREMLHWTLDAEAMAGTNQHGQTIALRPFMGVMGLPPDEPGIHSTIPPRFCGGNLDCRELVEGSILYLPITVAGALFSVGDGHGVQGDGEVSGVALECPMERVTLTFEVREDMPLKTPRARTSNAWLTLGFHEDLHEAAMLALEDMLALMGEQYDLSRVQALALASLVVDLRVTQIANGVLGVHAVLPDGSIT
jgi:acetamidase/formamidase